MVLSFAGHHTTTFLYLYMIMILQLLFNMTLFLCTSYKIRKLQQETKKITKSGESRKFNRLEADKDRFANPYISGPPPMVAYLTHSVQHTYKLSVYHN